MEGDYPKWAVINDRVPAGHAWIIDPSTYRGSTKWGNGLLEELKEHRAFDVAGSHLRWPSLREGTPETERQYQQHMMQWGQDTIVMVQDGEVFHSRWGYMWPRADKPTPEWKKSFGIPELADKRSGARYWPIGKV